MLPDDHPSEPDVPSTLLPQSPSPAPPAPPDDGPPTRPPAAGAPQHILPAVIPFSSPLVLPRVPGYEILDVLGRGGMAVVYKARHLRLNRTVALKMILHASHAGPDEHVRFLLEAEAIAAIKHPGVVQVYDFGRHEGAPYFALEFCEGGSLAKKLQGKPIPPREAADLVEQVARAVQAAHEVGIVHRDLKPGNVLLSSAVLLPAEGTGTWTGLVSGMGTGTGTVMGVGRLTVKVTDFGLARRIDVGSGLTLTDQVMGTPSYMPPEQARATRAAGPPADVYAIGAILYECLTGRPPFLAATSLETLHLVLNAEPPSPRSLNVSLPRDLETICLKCLHKEPERRYESAQALADDLRRWLTGEPILARPAGAAERAVKWARRRPGVAASLAGALLAVAAILTLAGAASYEWLEADAQRMKAEQALRDRDLLEQKRALDQVEALRAAAPGAVPGILDHLARNRDAVLPRLRELHAAENDPAKKARLALALLDFTPEEVRDELVRAMFAADDPAEVVLICDTLRPYATGLREPLWAAAARREDDPETRFRALVALAAFAPGDERWKWAAADLVRDLLGKNPLQLGVWVRAVEPVSEAMYEALGSAFRDATPGKASRREAAAQALLLYLTGRPDPQTLYELLLDSDGGQYALLRPLLKGHRDEVIIARMNAELAKVPDYWKDGPLDRAWQTPADAVVSEIEKAGGIVAARWALCQALPMGRLAAVTEAMGAAGYRPVSVRPWGQGRAATVWMRDGRDWKLEQGLTADALRGRDAGHQKAGLIPADVAAEQTAGGNGGGDGVRYVALWRRAGECEEGVLYAGVAAEKHEAQTKAFASDGYAPVRVVQQASAEGGVTSYSGVWYRGKEKAVDPQLWCDEEESMFVGRVAGGDGLLLDVGASPAARRYASVWSGDATRQAEGLCGLAPAAHLAKCRELAAKGYRPVALSLASLPGAKSPLAASVWHRPVVLAEKETLAARQATAAAILLTLNQTEQVWPLLKHSDDPTRRSYLVWRAGERGAEPRLLTDRLQKEQDVSIRRALILALGEYDGKRLPEKDRTELVETLLAWYRNDPDPGIHAAISWLLRHGTEGPTARRLDWGQADALAKIDAKELAGKKPRVVAPAGRDGAAGWYVTREGQTMAMIRGPIEFRMGAPLWDPDRHAADERPHMRRIPRSCAIGATQVTVGQWKRFVKDRPGSPPFEFLERLSSDPNGPVVLVTYAEAVAYCNWLSEKDGIDEDQWCYPRQIGPGTKPHADYLSRTGYRLPSEAEWEYACKAGTEGRGYFGTAAELLPRYAHIQENSKRRPWPVGQKRPNDLGLSDALGNVWTWCCGAVDYPKRRSALAAVDAADLRPLDDSINRPLRGGSFYNDTPAVRSSGRRIERPDERYSTYGVRVCRTLPADALPP